MLHRSSVLPGARLAAAVLSMLALTASAAAAADVPTTVVGPTPAGATFSAYVEHGQLCAGVTPPKADDESPFVGADPSCDAMPVLPPLGVGQWSGAGTGSGTTVRYAYGVIAGTGLVTMQLRAGGRVVAQTPTQPSTLPGAAGELRFAVLDRPASPAVDEIALLDAGGIVRGAIDVQDDAIEDIGFPTSTLPDVATTRFARGHFGRVRWALGAATRTPLVPTPLLPERRLAQPCAVLRWTSAKQHNLDALCGGAGDDTTEPLASSIAYGCSPVGAAVTALTVPTVGRVVAVLGDGSRREIALHPLPGAAAGGRRAGSLFLAPGIAVRRLIAYGSGRRVVTTDDVRAEPGRAGGCANTTIGHSQLGSVTPDVPDQSGAAPAPHRVVVQDDGARLCVALDRAPQHPGECGNAPVEASGTELYGVTTREGRFVYGVVPADVTAARLTLDDGSARVVPATAIPGYAGQYAAVEHLVAADVAAPRRVLAYALLDARGRAIGRGYGPDGPRLRFVRTLGRVPGLAPLTLSTLTDVAKSTGLEGTPCVSFGAVSAARPACVAYGLGQLGVRVDCAPRRMVISGILRHAADRVTIHLAGGRIVRPHVVRLPAVGKVKALGSAVLVFVLGAHEQPRSVVLGRGRDYRRQDLVLPAAARQCGYDAVGGLPG
jgi:hypothetical protein